MWKPFRKKINKNAQISKKIEKMENWFSKKFQLFQKNEKGKRQKNSKKQKMGGAREARAPHFLIFCNFSFIFLFHFFGKVGNFQKINFPFFHFFVFLEICAFLSIFIDFLRNPERVEPPRASVSLQGFFIFWKSCKFSENQFSIFLFFLIIWKFVHFINLLLIV